MHTNSLKSRLLIAGLSGFFLTGFVFLFSAGHANATVWCETNEDCNDGNVCNGVEFCSEGSCYQDTPMYCADDNSCTSDSCDPLEGCIYIDICEGPVCGNGILEEERCDDYNTESGDGCSSTCEVEYCGDGIVNNGYYEGGYGDGDWDGDGEGMQFVVTEECDDGNENNNDNCDNSCQKHSGGGGSSCTINCDGDEPQEELLRTGGDGDEPQDEPRDEPEDEPKPNDRPLTSTPLSFGPQSSVIVQLPAMLAATGATVQSTSMWMVLFILSALGLVGLASSSMISKK